MRYKEALSDDDRRRLLDLEGRILDLKRDLIDAEADEKESIQQDIENIRQQMDNIRESLNNYLEEAEYKGKKVTLDKPFRSNDNKHKFYVYVKNDKGNIIKLGFGDPNMEIKRDDPERRKSFRARHGCDKDPGPKWKAKYWSCKMWQSGRSVSDVLGEEFVDADKISTISGKSYSELYRNPTRKELDEAFERDFSALNYNMLRGFLTLKGDLYVSITEEAELIHDQLLKLIDKLTEVEYQNTWEIYSTNKILAVFVDKDYSIMPSEESYQSELDTEILHAYSSSVASNRDLSHMEFVYDF